MPLERDASPARERPLQRDAGPYHRRYVEAGQSRPRRAERAVLDRPQVVRGLLDSVGDVSEVVEQLSAEPGVERRRVPQRIQAKIEIAQRNGQGIAYLVRDHTRLPCQLAQRVDGREAGTRRAGGDAQYAQAEARQLEDHPLATAPFDAAGRGSGGAQSYGRDTPPAAIRQPAADPAAVLNERRAPLSQGEVEVQLGIVTRRVGDTADQAFGFYLCRDFPQTDDAALEGDAGLAQHLALGGVRFLAWLPTLRRHRCHKIGRSRT